MNRAPLIAKIGTALWGTDWAGHMAEHLHRERRLISDWESGKSAVPTSVWSDLREVVRLHGLRLAELDQEIVREFDASYQADLERASSQNRR